MKIGNISSFLRYNLLLQPITMIVGLVGSILAIRLVGAEYYASVVTFYTTFSLLLFLFSLGANPTLIKYLNSNKIALDGETLIVFVFVVQLLLALIVVSSVLLFISNSSLLGAYSERNTEFLFYALIPLAILSSISRSYLTAKLENKIYLGSELVRGILLNVLIAISALMYLDIKLLLYLIFFTYCICEIPVIFCLRKFKLKDGWVKLMKSNPQKLKPVFFYFTNISMVRVSKICFELPFIVLILNLAGLPTYVALISVFYRVIAIMQKVLQLPVDRLLPSLLSSCDTDIKANEVMSYSYKYYCLTTALLSFLIIPAADFILYDIYSFSTGSEYLVIVVFITSMLLAISPSNAYIQMRMNNSVILKISIFTNLIIAANIYVFHQEPMWLLVSLFSTRLVNNAVSFVVVNKRFEFDRVRWLSYFALMSVLFLLITFFSRGHYLLLGSVSLILFFAVNKLESGEIKFLKRVLKK
ncbi:oligosaccharide flippase family protein [Pseudoalteromonas sp. PA2MD11]|uniref:oligosaccharide flippase family protein n=1 Tax=Pseudoalteromonas sp. PA2MD11 TaxID=2785057 RepID=UPI001AE04C95|nr:oligosaccharide flippase family protein [Pseudoalteromonas sp. PA2MD11]